METKHTQGEWVVKSNSELCWVESKTHHIATVSFSNESNAKLIAAAPDLLDACKRVDSLYSEVERIVSGEVLEMLNHVRNAIKKATT